MAELPTCSHYNKVFENHNSLRFHIVGHRRPLYCSFIGCHERLPTGDELKQHECDRALPFGLFNCKVSGCKSAIQRRVYTKLGMAGHIRLHSILHGMLEEVTAPVREVI